MAATQVVLSQSWGITPCAVGPKPRGTSNTVANCMEAWSSSRSLFSCPMTQLGANGPSLQSRRSQSRGCRAQGLLPDVAGLVAAGASAIGLPADFLGSSPDAVLAPLALLEEPAQWRVVAALAVTLWYITAKPGPVQGLLDLMWAPVAERKTTSFAPASLSLGKQLGEGSFGVVFEGWVDSPRGRQRVVLKKVKAKVAGAEEMRASELYFNQRLQRAARGSCADFLGTCQVDRASQKGKLVEGTWLVWRYQGSSNLESFLRRRDFPGALAGPLLGERGVSVRSDRADVLQRDCAVVQTVCRHILESLRAVHATGVVHRDVKPLNLVLDEDTLRFKLVDLGAAVDLRTGYNYVPDETIMDPIYCAPEEYILPINMPDAPPGPLMNLVAPLLFMAHTPDKFDCFSAGLVLLQLAVPHLRYDRNLAQFNVALAASGYDLDRWRKTKLNFAETELEILDANGGAAWDLARSLLRPRDGLWCPRPTAAQALRHKFLTQPLRWAVEPPPSPTKATPSEKRKALRSGKNVLQQPAPGFAWGGRAERIPANPAAAMVKAESSNGIVNRSRSGPKLIDAGMKFDRKVKLKATGRFVNSRPESQVAWSGLLPLSMPFDARARPPAEDASSQEARAAARAEPLSGLKRLMGLENGGLPSASSPPKERNTGEFPHVSALGQLLWATQLHQQVPVGLQSLSFGGKRASDGGQQASGGKRPSSGGQQASAGKRSSDGGQRSSGGKRASEGVKAGRQASGGKRALGGGKVAQLDQGNLVQSGQWGMNGTGILVSVAAATAAIAGGGVMASWLVTSSIESGYTMGQGLVQGMTAAAALAVMQRIAVRLTRRSSSAITRPAYSTDASSEIMPALGTPAHNSWLFSSNRRQEDKEMPGGGAVGSVTEMEAQLAALEATLRENKECNAAQKALLSRVKALVLDASMRPAHGRAAVP